MPASFGDTVIPPTTAVPPAGKLTVASPRWLSTTGTSRNAAGGTPSLTGIRTNLLPYWLTRYPSHQLHGVDPVTAARSVRGLAEQGDELALKIFEQQARALGVLFTIASNFTDPDAYFPAKGATSGMKQLKRLCHTKCDVREQCLQWALDYERENPRLAHGLYGGMTARERKDLLWKESA